MRTSTGTFFGLGEHPVLRDIESRISAVTHLPAINGEGIQVPLPCLRLLMSIACCIGVCTRHVVETGHGAAHVYTGLPAPRHINVPSSTRAPEHMYGRFPSALFNFVYI